MARSRAGQSSKSVAKIFSTMRQAGPIQVSRIPRLRQQPARISRERWKWSDINEFPGIRLGQGRMRNAKMLRQALPADFLRILARQNVELLTGGADGIGV